MPFRRLAAPRSLVLSVLALGAFAAPALHAQSLPPEDWYLQDATTGGYPGAAVDRAYELVAGRTPRTVVVAVIDGGVDVAHPDLQGRLWTNPRETPGNGVDDDRNGFVDDVHGWNFLGGPDGRSVDAETYELTREAARLRDRFAGKTREGVPAAERAEFDRGQRLLAEVREKRESARQELAGIESILPRAREAFALLRTKLGKEDVTAADLGTITDTDPATLQAKSIAGFLLNQGAGLRELEDYARGLRGRVDCGYNLDCSVRAVIVQDDPTDYAQHSGYGNADVTGPDAGHGTHVAGIIGALRANNAGNRGVADAVRIMAVRAVPNGDERDKDVANAIRYAVDNGANIINMSFGKALSPGKPAVDEAVRYAVSKGVLLVHAAGNDGKDVDTENNFPNASLGGTRRAATWVEVGASGPEVGAAFAAPFSNYGRKNVDLFAPGVSIFSTLPGGVWGRNDGTSMAAPVVSGVAALVMAYYPTLTAEQVRSVLVASARRFPNLQVSTPGGDTRAAFSTLSATGGVVDARAALEAAARLAGGGTL